jgi:hypothetical protein
MNQDGRVRTLRRDGDVPRARVSVRGSRLSVEVWALSQAAELATWLALVEAARAAGGGAGVCVVGPHRVTDAQPPRWYGRLLLDDRERMAAARAAAAKVMSAAGYLVLPETLTRLGRR